MSSKITRRRFLVLGGGAGLSAFLGGAYVVSACPLSDTGVCVGPCAAYIDRRGDGLCDRAYADRAMVQAVAQEHGKEGTTTAEAPITRCPLGLVNDPYPGECQHYIDQDGDGFCDLSVPLDVGQASSQMPARVLPDTDIGQAPAPDADPGQGPASAQAITVACPFGLVNDPYPGQCRRYVDRDGDGICDLSVPQDVGQASSQMPARVLPDNNDTGNLATPDPDVGQAFMPDNDDDAGPASPTPSPAPSVPQPQAGVACPFGLVNDPYPGQCRRYVDGNGDGICDLSELGSGLNAPEAEEGRQGRRRGWGNGRR